ncbi:thiol:disulfide interchange protein DsbA [Candidatus Photodesmus katoptron]|uniref:thiol:disulfide interchange protein DsbA/DsbL n=1 Tax=Candidatus Photodesmus anomalopis TaxID=28176 RepID=UPI0004D9DACF|nr:thiol:disulfide interchange protein DsbA/DsbL [Candidatus Photodesmus katoptron]KEY90048.1 thiol:disulfide interchange protein DsbA [Candidatus Photodesmus katoptron]
MKKIIVIMMTSIIISLSAYTAPFYQEGKDYTILNSEVSREPIITEYFSFYCSHCDSLEPVIMQLKKKFSHVQFQRKHVSFMGGEMAIPMSKAYATMLVLNVEKQMVPILFNRIHGVRTPPKNNTELRQIFIDEGIDGNKYNKAFSSFIVDSMVRRFDKEFQKSHLKGVPLIIVNNRYLVKSQSVRSIDDYVGLIRYLLNK